MGIFSDVRETDKGIMVRRALRQLDAPDVRHDYYDGLASLTAGRIFEEIQFIRE